MSHMWKPGDIVAWRGIYEDRVWHVQPTLVVRDQPHELVLALLPGTECVAEEHYPNGDKYGNRRWDFKHKPWKMAKYRWQTNRLLLILEPDKFYSTIYFWDNSTHEFLCYYINFQLPFKRTSNSVDTLDLDLDLIISPDYSHRWKDEDDYQKAISHGIILPEWVDEINNAKEEIFNGLENREYPLDGSWLNWMPEPNWLPPKLPENWDKI